MTHLDDLYEPGDDGDWTLDELAERDPGEPEHEPPLTLEEIEAAHALTFDKESSEDPYQAITLLLEKAVPQMVAQLREARQRIAAFEALETREEWVVTKSRDVPPPPHAYRYPSGDAALRAAERREQQAWRRTLIVHPWEPIDSEAPF